MQTAQPGILAPVPRSARYVSYTLEPDTDPREALQALAAATGGSDVVVGLGPSLVAVLDTQVPGLHDFPSYSARGVDIPATPTALWCWLRGDDHGVLLHRSLALSDLLAPAFAVEQVIDSFMYRDSRDLSGYIDGTENPQDEAAVAAAIVQGQGPGLDGSSFVAVQQWWHELETFKAMPEAEQDNVFGRHQADNEEFDEAPESAHVKRAAQESFSPEAFMVRRSMPWADGMSAGLVFVAFGKTFDAYEAVLKRMTGGEDGILDGLFRFTRPVTGAYYWCPPLKDGGLDLGAVGL